MPRIARERSKSGIYHIMIRGTNKQDIFIDDEDNLRFLETLDKYKEKCKIKVYGWCLMSNHVHLLAGEGQEDISITIKRIGVSYAWFYNWKYNTVGHVFQDRFKSEKVEDDAYLMTVVRYIHRNPIKAGIAKDPTEWKWSSCKGYYALQNFPADLLDDSLILEIFSKDRKKAIELFKEFNEQKSSDECLDDSSKKRLTDKAARDEIAKLITGCEITDIKNMPKQQRDEILKGIKGIHGVSLRQAARILGVSHVQIFNA